MAAKDSDERTTPIELFDILNAIFEFDLDAAATKENALCSNYFTKQRDALFQDWTAYKSVFCNPPYSRGQIKMFIRKAYLTAAPTIFVLPNDSSTEWFSFLTSKTTFLHEPNQRYKFNLMNSGAKFPTLVSGVNIKPARGYAAIDLIERLHKGLPGLTTGPGIWLP